MHTPNNSQHQTAVRPQSLTTVLAALCLLLVLSFSSTPSYADASNRKQAIGQALAQSGSDAKVLSVKQIKNGNGGVTFAVKLISNGRVKVIHIPKTGSE
ncbi:MAG: hypothetical protein V3U65_08125 [Granulosicoccaceae bacterium]